MSARLFAAAKVYAFNYCQDEAEDEEDCVCGAKQHAEAKELFAAIKEAEAAPLPAEQPSNPVPLTDAEILADETLRYHFGLNGGDGPVSPKGWKIINAVARIVGQQTKESGK